MTADLSDEKRGGIFHYRYPEFIRVSRKEFCPVCNDEPAPTEYDHTTWYADTNRNKNLKMSASHSADK